MSGHSKWSKIKHQKGANDAKRGAAFTKLAKAITIAANEGGGDPDMNFALRLAVDKAKAANMPGNNIDRAIKKGTGEIEGGEITRISYEAFGPQSSALIIDCSTDNTNRTISEVKNLVETAGGKMAGSGSVSWQFEEKGLVVLKPAKLKKAEKYGAEDVYIPVDKENLIMEIMEVEGVEDIVDSSSEDEDGNLFDVLEVVTTRESLVNVDKQLHDLGIEVLSAELIKVAKTQKNLDEAGRKRVEEFIEKLEEHDDVDAVWSDVKG